VVAIDAAGRPIEDSVPAVLRVRGQVRRIEPFTQRPALTAGDPPPEGGDEEGGAA
jgi:hypothetical protein